MAAFYFTGLHAGRYVLSALLSGENVFYGERTGPYVNTVKVGLGTDPESSETPQPARRHPKL